jgi:hypothetical protein
MRKLLFLSAFFALTQAAFAQVTVPSSVNTSFLNTYPGTQTVNWTSENGHYRGEFMTTDNTRTSVMYDGTGKLMQTEVDVRDMDLPLTVRESLKGNKSSRYTRITDADGVVRYGITIDDKRTIYDAEGKQWVQPNQKVKQ